MGKRGEGGGYCEQGSDQIWSGPCYLISHLTLPHLTTSQQSAVTTNHHTPVSVIVCDVSLANSWAVLSL